MQVENIPDWFRLLSLAGGIVTIALVLISLILLFLLRKKISKVVLLGLLIVLINAITFRIDAITAVLLVIVIDFYAEAREYLVAFVKNMSNCCNKGAKK
ncbi:MAG: hypothetical protein J7L47_05010 [Candidatus Odinarchaeota archaeon]|nr:hypothetical protein [Candidatus Odinarchaeota archaeon]